MNANDADGAAALSDPSIVIQIGPHEAQGIEAVRELAAQEGPESIVSAVEIDEIQGGDGKYEVAARRVQRWAETNELASEEGLTMAIHLGEDGLVTRAEMRPAG